MPTAPASWPGSPTCATSTATSSPTGTRSRTPAASPTGGIDIGDIVAGCEAEDRFGFEEVVWLLIFGKLPNRRQFDRMCKLLYDNRELPEYFPEDMIIKAPSKTL